MGSFLLRRLDDTVDGRAGVPLREQVIASLTEAILNHRLLPGERLVERELIEQLGVSRTTVREAIRSLASDGLVVVLPQRGAAVASASAADARALYDARAALEALVIERFVTHASLPQMDRLTVAAFELGEVVESTDDTRSILAARDRFYAALFGGAGSPVLQQLVETVQARVRALCASSLSEEGRSHAAAEELRAVVTAVRGRDTDLAIALMRDHIQLAAAATLRTLPRE
tara:strand:+ start:1695 stop:2387 length:693 start_codon:yes stop_codon:yes gene_type:complete